MTKCFQHLFLGFHSLIFLRIMFSNGPLCVCRVIFSLYEWVSIGLTGIACGMEQNPKYFWHCMPGSISAKINWTLIHLWRIHRQSSNQDNLYCIHLGRSVLIKLKLKLIFKGNFYELNVLNWCTRRGKKNKSKACKKENEKKKKKISSVMLNKHQLLNTVIIKSLFMQNIKLYRNT